MHQTEFARGLRGLCVYGELPILLLNSTHPLIIFKKAEFYTLLFCYNNKRVDNFRIL